MCSVGGDGSKASPRTMHGEGAGAGEAGTSATESEASLLQERIKEMRRETEKAKNEALALDRLLQHARLQRKVRPCDGCGWGLRTGGGGSGACGPLATKTAGARVTYVA